MYFVLIGAFYAEMCVFYVGMCILNVGRCMLWWPVYFVLVGVLLGVFYCRLCTLCRYFINMTDL